jgi:predicted TIM-barrel fold metal-dependent hydrolase
MEVAAWKVYTPYAPNNRTWMLDDPTYGVPMIEKARSLGVKLICAHKGLQLFGFQREYTSPRDIGVVAKAFPDMRFVVYHSGWQSDVREGAYNDANPQGVDVLIKSLLDNGIRPNSNVYAELGTTWRNIMSAPTQAAHVLGKLLKSVGEDNVLWGTDCIWSGSPQPQIVAFRAFQIDLAVANANGYPTLTPDLKRKVLGLNSARLYGIDPEARRCEIERDAVEKYRANYRDVEPDRYEPRYLTRGPITRRGMLRWFAEHGGCWSIG